MLEQAQTILWQQISKHPGLYVFLIVLFAAGAAFGALATGSLDADQRVELVQYLEFFLAAFDGGQEAPPPAQIFHAAFFGYLRTIGFMLVLGLTVVAAWAVPIIVFLRGFILGFAVGFLVSHFSWTGLLITVFAVLPQNVLAIPAVVLMAGGAAAFAFTVFRQGRRDAAVIRQAGSRLALITLLALLAVTVASLMEGYLAPALLRLISAWRP